MSSLPIIDISPLIAGHKEGVQKVAEELDNACRTWGFFYIVGHGIPKERMEALTQMARTFFDQPMEEKLKIDIRHSTVHRGYGVVGVQQADPDLPYDNKETFDMHCDLKEDHPLVNQKVPLCGPNVHPDIPGWRDLMETHYKDMTNVARHLLRGLAIAIGIDEHFFSEKLNDPLSGFRLIRYPVLPNEETGRVICGAHTDYDIVTILYLDNATGLQVRNLQGEWMDAPPVKDSYVVNIGDMMAMWSNDRYKSTSHRVLNPGVDRISMPFFCIPNPNVMIEALENCYDSATNPRKYPNITAVEWLQKRYRETYTY